MPLNFRTVLWLSPGFAFLEGKGHVQLEMIPQIAAIRFCQEVIITYTVCTSFLEKDNFWRKWTRNTCPVVLVQSLSRQKIDHVSLQLLHNEVIRNVRWLGGEKRVTRNEILPNEITRTQTSFSTNFGGKLNFIPSFLFPERLHCCYSYFHCSYPYNYYNYSQNVCIKCWVSAFHTEI